MTSYKFGDIVLVEFPQSTREQRKRRPALVILDIGDQDIVLAPITSKTYSGLGDIKVGDWSESGLIKESWVRLAKITTLLKSDLVRTFGSLTNSDRRLVITEWQRVYALDEDQN